MSDILFIADLHLTPQRPQMMDLFTHFAEDIAANAKALYILGDFFEAWWGDDDPALAYQGIFDSLRNLVDNHNTRVYLMHGNRDFLIGQTLAEHCHFSLINEPYPLQLAGKKALLIHGDSLCTDDIEYQKYRQMVRSPLWRQQTLSKSLEERYALAQSIRQQSKTDTAIKSEEIMDVNDSQTRQLFIEHDINLLIHGHTHRPAFHQLSINNKPVQRIVLGDWYQHASYLCVSDDNHIEMRDYPSTAGSGSTVHPDTEF